MPSRIEDYAMIGDCMTAALVGRDGSIDWLCLPRFDSGACMAALLGDSDHGRWLIAPAGGVKRVTRRYVDSSLVLRTEWETEDGAVAVTDFMPLRTDVPDVVRLVDGLRGSVPMTMELVMRFDYGSVVPWVRKVERGISAIAGPDMLSLRTDVPLTGRNFRTHAAFTVAEGQRIPFDLTWYPSTEHRPAELDASKALDETLAFWSRWASSCSAAAEDGEAIMRSLVTLKGLTYSPTGGIVAAPTTSLPELLGGVRNWDYRFCWLRDATFTLYALMLAGHTDEAAAWREWLLRAVAGLPAQMQIMYGLAGERRLTELEIPWLPGHEGSVPVRIGNGAWQQHQLDVFGEVMDALHQCRRFGLDPSPSAWSMQRNLMEFLETRWAEPDEGIWEVRGPSRQFTHSKMMAWVAFDRAVKSVEAYGVEGPLDRWRARRAEIHEQVCREGFDARRNAFVQFYGSDRLDASLLMMPLVGFLPATDPRVIGTVEAIRQQLVVDGFVVRYLGDESVDGLPAGEGAFLLCTFWLADCLALMGRRADAQAIFDGVLAIRNDVGLLSEAYDPRARRLLGNMPQAFSHVGLVNTALNLRRLEGGPAEERRRS